MGNALSNLNVEVQLDGLHYQKTSDPNDETISEPYIWTVFFKADGDTLVWDGNTQQLHSRYWIQPPLDSNSGGSGTGPVQKPQPNQGPRQGHWELGVPHAFIDSRGGDSAGDLGVKDTGPFDFTQINIPPAVGKFNTTLKPIPATTPDTVSMGGYVGVIFVLMEADNTSQGARFNADTWFYTRVASIISNALASVSVTQLETNVFTSKIDNMTTYIEGNVRQAIVDQTSTDPDDLIGVKTLYWNHGDLASKDIPNSVFFLNFGEFTSWTVSGHAKASA